MAFFKNDEAKSSVMLPKASLASFSPIAPKKRQLYYLFLRTGLTHLRAERGKFVVSQLRSLRSLRCDNDLWV